MSPVSPALQTDSLPAEPSSFSIKNIFVLYIDYSMITASSEEETQEEEKTIGTYMTNRAWFINLATIAKPRPICAFLGMIWNRAETVIKSLKINYL